MIAESHIVDVPEWGARFTAHKTTGNETHLELTVHMNPDAEPVIVSRMPLPAHRLRELAAALLGAGGAA